MKEIKEKFNLLINRRSKTKAYGEKQINHLFMMVVPLIGLGLFIEYCYYATIGKFGQTIAAQIVLDHFKKIIIVVFVAVIIDLILAHLKGIKVKSLKNGFKLISSRPALTFSLIFIMTLAYDMPISAVILGTIVIVLFSQNTKIGYSYYSVHPVLIGYMSGLFGLLMSNNKLGIYESPLLLSAPFMTSVNGPLVFTLDQFQLKYYSLSTVALGLFEGSMSFILFVPILLSGVFLLKRKIIDLKVSGIYFLIYGVLSLSYHQGANFESWVFPLQLLNGSVLLTGLYLITDVVTLPTRTVYKYVYVTFTAILTFILTYYVHFVFGAYMALMISQVSVLLIRLIQVNMIPSIKLQLIKS